MTFESVYSRIFNSLEFFGLGLRGSKLEAVTEVVDISQVTRSAMSAGRCRCCRMSSFGVEVEVYHVFCANMIEDLKGFCHDYARADKSSVNPNP